MSYVFLVIWLCHGWCPQSSGAGVPGGVKVIWHHFSFDNFTILAAILASYRVILVKKMKLLTLLMRQSLAFSANAPATRSAAPPLWGGASRRRNRATAPGIWSKSSWKSLAPAISECWKLLEAAGSCWKLLEAGISSSATVWLFGDIHATFTRTSAMLSETTT